MKCFALLVVLMGCGNVIEEPPPPGSLAVAVDPPKAFIRQGEDLSLDVTVTRTDTAAALDVTVANLPSGVTVQSLQIAADGTTGTLHFASSATATQGIANLTITATAADDATTTGDAPAFRLLVGGQPGTLDQSFDTDGKVIPELGGLFMIARGLVLTDRGLVVTGAVGSSPAQAITVRVRDDGTLDDTFGSGGFVSTGVTQLAEGIGIAAAANGDLVVSGVAGSSNPGVDADFGVFRYDAAGALVAGFGQSGVVSLDSGANNFGEWHNVLLQPDGSIVVGGTLFNAGTGRGVRYSATGVQDLTFNINEPNVNIEGSALQPDGKILFCGSQNSNFWTARYNTTGAHDAGFGANGVVTTNFASTDVFAGAHALLLVANNKILVVGTAGTAGATTIALARYNANGSLDVTFGTGGKITTTIPFETHSGAAPVVSGSQLYFVGERPTSDKHPAVARINIDDGSVDTTFGSGGSSEIDFGIAGTQNNTGGFGLAVDADGRVIVGAEVGSTQRMAIARLWP